MTLTAIYQETPNSVLPKFVLENLVLIDCLEKDTYRVIIPVVELKTFITICNKFQIEVKEELEGITNYLSIKFPPGWNFKISI